MRQAARILDFARRTGALIREDARLYGLMALYIAVATAVLAGLSRDVGRTLSLYFDSWLWLAFELLFIYTAVRLAWDVHRHPAGAEPVTLIWAKS